MPICEQCGKEHDGSFGSGRFCCRSCSNKWVALHQSDEAKAKKSRYLTPHPENLKREWDKESRENHSIIMTRVMESLDTREKISTKMKGRQLSTETRKKISENLKLSHLEGRNRGWVTRRGVESYAETFWREVLENSGIPFEQEKKVLHSEIGLDTRSYYFLDFYLPEKHVDLEIDGHQHYEESRKVHDAIRDSRLTTAGYHVYRIKYVNPKNSLVVQEDINRFLDWYKNL